MQQDDLLSGPTSCVKAQAMKSHPIIAELDPKFQFYFFSKYNPSLKLSVSEYLPYPLLSRSNVSLMLFGSYFVRLMLKICV